MINIIESYVEKVLKEKIIQITLCSRLMWKNIVYYCKTDQREYAIKFYKEFNHAYIRNNVEINMYKIIKNIGIHVPKIYHNGKLKEGYILITEWINGMSLKQIVNNSGIIQNQKKKKCLLDDYKFVWNLNINDKINKLLNSNKLENYNTPGMIYTRTNIKEDDMFIKFKDIRNIELITKLYKKLEKELKIKKNVINSDISLHEVLLKDKNYYWIDLESFTIGDVNNDLAGIFYSLSNSLINKKHEIEYLMEIIIKNQYFSYNNFIFYLIERIFCANFLDQVNVKEINFYIKFILDKYK